jgi:hypothetical protein
MNVICDCGITCRTIDEDGKLICYCPRCDKVVQEVEEPKPLVEAPKFGAFRITAATCPCDQCGELMEDACKAKCPSCGWEKPCG